MFTVVCAASAVFLICMTYLGVLVCQTQMAESSPIMHWAHGRCVRGYTDRRSTDVFEQISYYLVHLNGTQDEKGEEEVYVSYGIYIVFVFLMLGVPIAFSLGLGSVVAISLWMIKSLRCW